MELSQYLKIFPSEDRPDQLLLFSTKQASKILLSKATYHAIEDGSLSSLDNTVLQKLGMLVPDHEAERRSVFTSFEDINARGKSVHVMVVLNLDCNFSCIYCYEGEMKGSLYMSEETAGSVVDFIKGRLDGKSSLLVDFYGGEPLLSYGLVKSISHQFQSLAYEKGVSYNSTMVTNGSLFRRKIAEELTPLGLKSVKITIDGPANVHNQYRPFRSGAGSFDTIIRNIKDTADLVEIGIGGNYDSTNYKRFIDLLDFLLDEGITPKKIGGIKFDPVFRPAAGDGIPMEFRGGCTSQNEPWLIDASIRLREAILQRGYDTPKPQPVICTVEKSDTFVVNFDGSIYKCPGFLGKDGFAIGNVASGIEDYHDTYKLGIWKNDECAECTYLPFCFGGCRYMTYLREGTINRVDCPKSYLDASLETFLKQDVKYRAKANSR